MPALRAAVVLAVLAALLPASRHADAAALPPGFSDSVVASVGAPTALAFTPDGRMLVTTQEGQLRVVRNGVLLGTPALSLGGRVCTNSERGLLGVAVDPAFASNRSIFLYYTFNAHGSCSTKTPSTDPHNRVSRFVLTDANSVDPSTERVLIDEIPSPAGNHNAGDLRFGRDGHLYVTVGDGGCDYADLGSCAGANDAARDTHVLIGKVLRVTRDGGIPADNPHRGSDSARCSTRGRTTPGRHCQETFASGLRNPFRFAFDPDAAGTRFFVNDVGQNLWEEINLGRSGADYGWNLREGRCANGSTSDCGSPPAGLTNPIHVYGRDTGCRSITGGAFVPDGVWPSEFDDDYLFADYVCGTIFSLRPAAGGGWTRTPFVTGLGASSAVHMAFGPYGGTQALYYTTYAGGGEVRRIAHTRNRPPVAAVSASPRSGAPPLDVEFDAGGSRDPEGGRLTYLWSFGDGVTRQTTSAQTSYTYGIAGSYTAALRVRDPRGAVSDSVTVQIEAGNTPPSPAITSPSRSDRFRVGRTVTLRGTATDAEDGRLAGDRLSWTVTLHHAGHTHPFVPATAGDVVTFTAPAPEDLAATKNSFLRLRLTATDSAGSSTAIVRDLLPRRVDVTLATQPPGLRLAVNGTAVTGPARLVSWAGYRLNVGAPAQTDAAGRGMAFSRWSDGGPATHAITTPAAAATYTAVFVRVGTGLRAEYFDSRDFTASALTRIDPTVGFDWGTGSPAWGIGADTFSVRWTGRVRPRYSETYRFTTTSDDGVRLWVNGRLIVGDYSDHARRERSGTITLRAGLRYDLRLDYYENGGRAVAGLAWSSPSQSRQTIPAHRLSPPP